MTVGFYNIPFDVLAPDATLPYPTPDETGILIYEASVRLRSTVDVDALIALASTITIRPALGLRNSGSIVIEAGDGVRHLTIPLPDGEEVVYRAILTAIEPVANMLRDDAYSVDVSFVLIETV